MPMPPLKKTAGNFTKFQLSVSQNVATFRLDVLDGFDRWVVKRRCLLLVSSERSYSLSLLFFSMKPAFRRFCP